MPAATTEVHTMVNFRAYCGSIAYELEEQPTGQSRTSGRGRDELVLLKFTRDLSHGSDGAASCLECSIEQELSGSR